MRDEMLSAVIRRAMDHEDFRRDLARAPREALRDHGFALEEPEYREIEKLSGELRSDESEAALERIATRFGVEPKRTP